MTNAASARSAFSSASSSGRRARTPDGRRGAASSIQPRLFSSDQAAAYLGLGSRWAVRRLMVNGELQVVRLAGKLRFDREDLDRLIATRKSMVHDAQVSHGPGTPSRSS